MNQQFNLKIDKPCSEKFEQFQSTKAGGFCLSCQKEVIDFTAMSDIEILHYFKNKPAQTCGRFNKQQIKTYTTPNPIQKTRGFGFLAASLLGYSLFSLFLPTHIQAQHKTPTVQEENSGDKLDASVNTGGRIIQGTVFDEATGEPMLGVTVVLKGTANGIITDIDGKFQLTQSIENEAILLFSYLGYKTQEFVINDKSSNPFIVNMIYDEYDIMGEVSINQLYTSKPSLWQKFKGLFR